MYQKYRHLYYTRNSLIFSHSDNFLPVITPPTENRHELRRRSNTLKATENVFKILSQIFNSMFFNGNISIAISKHTNY